MRIQDNERDDVPPKNLKALDAREFRFVEEYVGGSAAGVARRSALLAGYPLSTAEVAASEWLRNPKHGGKKPHVYWAVRRRREEMEKKMSMTTEELLLEASKLASFNAGSYIKHTSDGDPYLDMSMMTLDEMAAISSVSIEDYVEGRGEDARTVKKLKVSTWDKRASIDMLMKAMGMHKSTIALANDPANPLTKPTHNLEKLDESELETYLQLLRKMEA